MDMTTTKAKVAFVITLVGAILVAVSQLALPDNWQSWIGAALLVLTTVGTAYGVYTIPNKPIPPAAP